MGSLSIFDACAGDPAARIACLEEALAGTGLAAAIDEVVACGGSGVDSREVAADEVRRWLAGDADAVLAGGLARLSRAKLDEMFRRPGLLVGLQELVLEQGGEHWRHVLARNVELDALARRHERALVERLGLERGPARGSVGVAGAADGRGRRGWSAGRALVWLVPLAAAAAVLLTVVTMPRPDDGAGVAPNQPGVGATVADGGDASMPTVIVSRIEPAEPDPTTAAGAGSAWPAHPWKAVAGQPDGGLGRLADGSRDWSSKLRESPDVSAGQVSAAAAHARDAIVAIDKLAGSGELPIRGEARATLRAKCRRAADVLGRLHAEIEPGDADAAAVETMKADILSSLREVESALEDAASARSESRPLGSQ